MTENQIAGYALGQVAAFEKIIDATFQLPFLTKIYYTHPYQVPVSAPRQKSTNNNRKGNRK